MKGLIKREHRLCDLKEDLEEELNLLRYIFISNGCPVRRVDETFKHYKPTNETYGEVMAQLMKEQEYVGRDVICVPYIPGFSEKMQFDLRKAVSLVYIKNKSFEGMFYATIRLKDLRKRQGK